jgi:hypothetical protein
MRRGREVVTYQITLRGALEMTIPRALFHIAMAYTFLRNNGVDVGQTDFLCSINLVRPND